MTLESTIESYLVKRATALGGIILKGDIPSRRFLDRICIMPDGVTLWVECKRPSGGRRSKLQEDTIRRLLELGHQAFFVKTKEEVDAVLSGTRVFDSFGRLVVSWHTWPDQFRISTPKGITPWITYGAITPSP